MDKEKIIKDCWTIYKDIPNRFMSVIVSFSKSKSFDEAILEWEEKDPDVGGMYEDTCICSHKITENYYFHNKFTDAYVVIGSECVNKFGHDEMIHKHRSKKKAANYEGDRRQCQSCGNHRISPSAESWIVLCKS